MSLPVALILAAGVGRRLGALTAERPKALVELGGATLLERQLIALRSAGFREVVVVTGHCAELVDGYLASRAWGLRVRSSFNPHFESANNIVSFLVAADVVKAGFCLLNSDIVFDTRILADAAAKPPGSWLVMDADEPLGDEEMKIQLDDAGVVRRVSKKLSPTACAGEYIGIARFDEAGTAEVTSAARALVDRGQVDLYYEDAIDAAASRLTIRPVPTAGRRWTEIDDMADYERALGIAAELDTGVRA